MTINDSTRGVLPRRSALSVPAINRRALEKALTLDCDVVIFDLEDSVAPSMKQQARDNLRQFWHQASQSHSETVIRINGAGSEFHEDDLALALGCRPGAILLPKVGSPQDVTTAEAALERAGAGPELRLWAMIETPDGILGAAAIAATARAPSSRLDCLVLGLNDLRKDTGVADLPGRPWLVPWLMQTVLAARAGGIDVIDSVFNNFRDIQALEDECRQGRDMGFDGKMLIHPAQIDIANRYFGPDAAALQQAQEIVAAFAAPDAENANVINMNGIMIERLHAVQAGRLIRKAQTINARKDRNS